MNVQDKFSRLGTDNAPGQEVRQKTGDLHNLMRGGPLAGTPVDFSHGDVDAFTPTPGSFDVFAEGVRKGGKQAYTEYRGAAAIREELAGKLAAFTGAPVDAADGMILTPGTQGALFLAITSTVGRLTTIFVPFAVVQLFNAGGVYAVVLGISVALVVQALLALFYRIETNGRSLEAIAVAEGAPAVRPG